MKIKTILIDDEQASLKSLQWELEPHREEIEILEACDTPVAGLKAIRTHRPDLVFLDIEMPGMNGFELLRNLKGELDFAVVFTTAYDEFAIQAIRVNALDYLLKPIDPDELKQALGKVKTRLGEAKMPPDLQRLLESVSRTSNKVGHLVLPTQDGMEFVNPDRITHCQSDGNYTRIFQSGEAPIFISRTLKEVEEMLSGRMFFRVHHSYLVNLQFVKKYLRSRSGTLILQDGTEVPVARRRKDELIQALTT